MSMWKMKRRRWILSIEIFVASCLAGVWVAGMLMMMMRKNAFL
jgi:hypothetical protein